MRERMLAGDLYRWDPELGRGLDRAAALSRQFNLADPADAAAGRALLEELLGRFGPEAHIRAPLYVDYGSNLYVGARTFVNFGLVALDVATITIGEDCQFGPNVQLLTATHPVEPGPRRARWEAARPITVGDNVWLGGGVIVCPGVTIGADSVIGAGAVVTRDVPPGVVAVGNPARVVRSVGG
jgi:maltose O-acetyltransferase